MRSRLDISNQWSGISEGMPVYDRDGDSLGKVIMLGDDAIVIEKGIFFPKDFTARYDDIEDVRDGTIYLNIDKASLSEWRNESYEGWQYTDDINAGRSNAVPRDEYRDRYPEFSSRDASQDEARMQLSEERLEAQKTMREAGQVRLRKVVHTEYKHFTVPVMREEVRIERAPVNESRTAAGPIDNARSFQEQTINVPVMEEEVTITKRPVVKEEVSVRKERVEEQREVSGEVRREDIDIQDETKTRRKKTA